MAREWTEFVQSQLIPWSTDDLGGLRPGASVKQLSRDDQTGALSLVVRYPEGFSAPGGTLAVDEEFLVLEGTLAAGPRTFGPLGYAHWPAGFDGGAMISQGGATLLLFFSGTPIRNGAPALFDSARLVEQIDGFEIPYTGNFHPEFPVGAGRKLLYTDPESGDTSWILGTMPLRWATRPERHPVVEEMYLLSGEVHGNCGVMRPGAYFWRPPHKEHGPYGSLTGNVYFFRTEGGSLTTDYVDSSTKFTWWPAYAPLLPPSLEEARGETESIARNW